eukprot:664711-Pelagomonas_calceolata.AAC.1
MLSTDVKSHGAYVAADVEANSSIVHFIYSPELTSNRDACVTQVCRRLQEQSGFQLKGLTASLFMNKRSSR